MQLGDPNVGMMGGFTPNAIQFFGADTVYNTAPTGMSDVATGSISFWFRKDGGDGTQMFMGSIGAVQCQIRSDNKIDIVIRDAALNIILETVSTSTFLAGAAWHHIATSWDTNHPAGSKLSQLYIDGVSNVSSITDTFPAANIGNSAFSNHLAIGSSQIHSAPYFIGALSEFYYNFNTRIDFSVAANLQKFRNGTHPANIGADGSVPTGSSPTIYMHNPAATVITNQGNSGNFTIFGSPADASTRP